MTAYRPIIFRIVIVAFLAVFLPFIPGCGGDEEDGASVEGEDSPETDDSLRAENITQKKEAAALKEAFEALTAENVLLKKEVAALKDEAEREYVRAEALFKVAEEQLKNAEGNLREAVVALNNAIMFEKNNEYDSLSHIMQMNVKRAREEEASRRAKLHRAQREYEVAKAALAVKKAELEWARKQAK